MLYITTRNKKETYTVHKTLVSDTAPDGGSFFPYKQPEYTPEQVLEFSEKSFNQCVAEILNAFFSARLTAWDVDFCIGKNPVRFESMNYRVLLAELWHNPRGDYGYLVERLYARLLGKETGQTPPDWVRTAVRIAMLIGVYGQLCAKKIINPGETLDLAVSGESFEAPMAAYYARKMGLPINTVLCIFDNDSNVWELIHRGTFVTSTASCEAKAGVEKLVSIAMGEEMLHTYIDRCEKGRSFSVDPEVLPEFSKGFFCAVTGKDRAATTVNSVYRSNRYVMDPQTALSYGGLQDYRAATGNSCVTLMLSEYSPECYLSEIAKATGVQEQKLLEQVKYRGE